MPMNTSNFAVIPSSVCSGHPHCSQVSPASKRLCQDSPTQHAARPKRASSGQIPGRRINVWSEYRVWASIDPALSPHGVKHPEDAADHKDTRKKARWEVCQIESKDHMGPYHRSESLAFESISRTLSKQGATSAPHLSCLHDVLSQASHQNYGGIISGDITLVYTNYG